MTFLPAFIWSSLNSRLFSCDFLEKQRRKMQLSDQDFKQCDENVMNTIIFFGLEIPVDVLDSLEKPVRVSVVRAFILSDGQAPQGRQGPLHRRQVLTCPQTHGAPLALAPLALYVYLNPS